VTAVEASTPTAINGLTANVIPASILNFDVQAAAGCTRLII